MASVTVPAKVKTWTIADQVGGNIRSGNSYENNQGYSFYNSDNNEYLTYKHQDWGINLGFVGDAKYTGHFATSDGQEREILSGELIAFAMGGEDKQFLLYAHRDYGINLNWSKEPVFQWRLFREDDQLGVPIELGTKIAILNEKGDDPDPDFLIHHQRTVGGQIGWPSTPGFWDHVWDEAKGKAGQYAIKAAKAYFGS